jgi:OOP family OmpA-OmpF porin
MPRRALFLTLPLVLASAPAFAADPVPSLDLRGFHAPADHGSGLYLEPASSPATFDWSAALWLSYATSPIKLVDARTDETAFRVIRHQVSGDLTVNVGFGERAALGVDLPFLVYQTGDDPSESSRAVLGDGAIPAQALGDAALLGKVTLVQPTSGNFGGFALALAERFSVPSGDDASYLGEGHFTSETRLLGEYRLVALGVHGALGMKFRGEDERFACASVPLDATGNDPCPTRFGHEIPFGLGLSLKPQALGFDKSGRFTFFLETFGYVPASPISPFEDARVSQAELALSGRYAYRDVSVLTGLGTALTGGIGNSPLRLTAALSWAPRVHDADADLIEDELDQCRELAEDRDGFQDEDGCPEGDNDDDGVPDEDDRCATEREDADGHLDEDGCLDGDNDADGFQDEVDACPMEAGVAEKKGCPNRDPDGDGVEGEADKCPNEAEDKDTFEDADGCPDPDNDGDGIGDKEDACPDVSGIPASDAKERGCPDPDPDRDTFQGANDKCPNEAEVWNGIDDEDGCADADPKKKAKPLVSVKETRDGPALELAGAVKFTDTNEIDPKSATLLRALAAELLAHPGWSVAVGVRPSFKGGPSESLLRAFAAVDALRRYSHRDDVAETVAWSAVKGTPRATEHGIGWLVLTPQPATTPAATPPAAPTAPAPAPTAPAQRSTDPVTYP